MSETVIEGAGGVVFNAAGKVLLLKHRKGDWVFAKGHIDEGETKLETALREIEEESGVVATCPDPEPTYLTRYANNKGIARCITWYLCYTEAGAVILREKTFPDGGFFSVQEARSRLTFQDDKDLLEFMVSAYEARL